MSKVVLARRRAPTRGVHQRRAPATHALAARGAAPARQPRQPRQPGRRQQQQQQQPGGRAQVALQHGALSARSERPALYCRLCLGSRGLGAASGAAGSISTVCGRSRNGRPMVQYQADCGLATTWYAILAHLPPSSFLRVCVSVYKYSMSLVSRAVWHVRDGSAPFRMSQYFCKIVSSLYPALPLPVSV